MIKEFVAAFDANREALKEQYLAKQPDSYGEIVADVIKMMEDCPEAPDPARITAIDHGDYQGTQVFVIGCTGYQPSTYYYVKMSYGSCSGCDTFKAIQDYTDEPSEKAANEFVTLALHIVQGLKKMGEEE